MEQLCAVPHLELGFWLPNSSAANAPWLAMSLWSSLHFAHPAMLWWMLAAALPWLLLWPPRLEPPQIRWAAMQFLNTASQEVRRSQRRSQWALLAIRTAILLLIPISLAQPFWKTSAAAQSWPTGPTHWIYLLDGSASLSTETVLGRRWDLLRQELARRWEQLPAEDAISVIVVSHAARGLLAQPSSDTRAVLEKLSTIEPTEMGTRWETASPQLTTLLTQYDSAYVRQRVVVVSDMQASSWESWPGKEGFLPALPALHSAVTWELLAVTPAASRQNVAIQELVAVEPSTVLGRPLRLRSQLYNWDREPRRVTAELTFDQRPVARQDVELAPQAATTVDWETVPTRTGIVTAELSLSADCFQLDNQLSVPIFVDTALNVLVVANNVATPHPVAVALTSPESAPYRTHAQLILPHQLQSDLLTGRTCVVSDDVLAWNESALQTLVQYVQAGGGWVAFLGPQTQPASYQQLQTKWPEFWPWTLAQRAPRGSYRWTAPGQPANDLPRTQTSRPETFSATVDKPTSEQARPMDQPPLRAGRLVAQNNLSREAAPLVDLWRRLPQSGWSSVPVWQYWQLESLNSATDTVLYEFANHDLAWAEQRSGRGGLLVCSTSPTLEPTLDMERDGGASDSLPWSALGKWPGFVPLMQAAALQTAAHRYRPGRAATGDAWPSSAESAARDGLPPAWEAWQRWSQGKSVPIDVSLGTIEQGGLYVLPTVAGTPTAWLTVQVPAGESQAETVAPELYAQFDSVEHVASPLPATATAAGDDAAGELQSGGTGQPAAAAPQRLTGDDQRASGPSWQGTVWGVLIVSGLLLLELWLGTQSWTAAN